MNKNEYIHCNLHIHNIEIKKQIKSLFNKKIPIYEKIVKIIDYSSILYKRFK